MIVNESILNNLRTFQYKTVDNSTIIQVPDTYAAAKKNLINVNIKISSEYENRKAYFEFIGIEMTRLSFNNFKVFIWSLALSKLNRVFSMSCNLLNTHTLRVESRDVVINMLS